MKLLWITECILRDNKSWRKNRSLYWLVYDKTKGQWRTTLEKKTKTKKNGACVFLSTVFF